MGVSLRSTTDRAGVAVERKASAPGLAASSRQEAATRPFLTPGPDDSQTCYEHARGVGKFHRQLLQSERPMSASHG